jgi:hypothetical protein
MHCPACALAGAPRTPRGPGGEWLGLFEDDAVAVGSFRILFRGVMEPYAGETLSGAASEGQASLYEVFGPRSLRLAVAYVSWRTGERDVRLLRCYESGGTATETWRAMPVTRLDDGHDRVPLDGPAVGARAARDGAPRVPVAEVLARAFGARCDPAEAPAGDGPPAAVVRSEQRQAAVAAFVLTRAS